MENLENYPTQYAVQQNLYDLSMLEEMDDDEYVLEILTMLLKETPADFKKMADAATAGITDTVYKQAHKLKSSAGVIQAEQLISLLEMVEGSAKKQATASELIVLVEKASSQYRLIEKSLRQEVAKLK